MFYFCLKTIYRPLTMSSLKDTCFQNNMCAETTLREFAISLVLEISCETVNVETERRNFLTGDPLCSEAFIVCYCCLSLGTIAFKVFPWCDP